MKNLTDISGGGGQNSSNELSDLIGSDIPDAPTGVIPDEYFRLSQDGTYYIVGDNASSTELLYHISGDIVIPSEFNGLPVKEISLGAFDQSNITSVVIPDSVTTIGICAFSDCSKLKNITIPDSVTTIYYSAFSHCSALTSITISDSVTTIDGYAFSYCPALTNVIIKGKPTVNSNAFISTPKLEKIYVIDGQGYTSTDTIDGKPIKILPATPAVVVKEMNVETMNIA